jgi:hypothetical protein
MFNDGFYNNKCFAEIAGISVQEMNDLEIEFVDILDFDLNVTKQEFVKYYKLIE